MLDCPRRRSRRPSGEEGVGIQNDSQSQPSLHLSPFSSCCYSSRCSSQSRKLAIKYHPDKCSGKVEIEGYDEPLECSVVMNRVNLAYEVPCQPKV